MKIFILSAGNGEVLEDLFQTRVAECATLLENQVCTLLLLGIELSKIFLVVDENNNTFNHDIIKNSKDLGIELIRLHNIAQRSFDSIIKLQLLGHFDEDALILNGDTYFDTNDIEGLLNFSEQSKLLVETRYNKNSAGLQIVSGNGIKYLDGVESRSEILPWDCYSGAAYLKFTGGFAEKKWPQKKEYLSLPYVQYLKEVLKINFQLVYRNSSNIRYNDNINSKDLIGGSGASLREENNVKKYATLEGQNKLVQEINWLQTLNSDSQKHFAKVLDYEISSEGSWYSMPKYHYASLRKLLITGLLTPEQCIEKLEVILKFLIKNIYSVEGQHTSQGWLQETHFDRFHTRYKSASKIKSLNKVFSYDSVIVNNIEYENLKELIQKVEKKASSLQIYSPKILKYIHGDLHFQNILVDINSDDFVLIDPRGELLGSDIYYDLGKLWHSVNGLYDLIHTDIATLHRLENKNKASFMIDYGPKNLTESYGLVKFKMFNLLNKYFGDIDPQWHLKTLFNEAMHFSSLFTFHLKNDSQEDRAILLYLTALRLNSQLLEAMENTHEAS